MSETKLGFGCAPILGRVNKKDCFYALKFAHELGIDYFDIARSYGWGEAESLLGKFLKQEKIPRETVEITTKFGLTPKNNNLIRIAKTLARNLVDRVPQSQNIVRSAARQVAPKVDFSVNNLIISLDKSLKSLRTDYIDNILFHGYDFQNKFHDLFEIIESLEQQKQLGKIKNYGFSISESLEVIQNLFLVDNIQPDLLQISGSSIGKHNRKILDEFTSDNMEIVIHSPFKIQPSIPFIFEQLSDRGLCSKVESILGREISKTEHLYEVILSYFKIIYFPKVIVTSMFNPTHIQKNQQVMQKNNMSKEQLQSFEELLFFYKIIPK